MKTKVITLANNQYALFTESGSVVFQSYETAIARIDGIGRAGDVFLTKNACEYSRTTSKYLYRFLQEYSLIESSFCNKKGIKALMQDGSIQEVETL